LQRAHTEELGHETRARQELSQKLDQYIDIVKILQDERDDLQDAVLQLVHKGGLEFLPLVMEVAGDLLCSCRRLYTFVVEETKSNFKFWPRSRLQIPGPLGG
jgi:hypothetical protein